MKIQLKICILIIIALICTQQTQAQFYTIKGKVLSADKIAKPLKYVNISVKNYPVGVSSNEVGEFTFHIPQKYYNDTLIVSYISYKSYECKISEIKNTDSLEIYLEPQQYELNEVVVLADNDVRYIIKKVVKSIRKNYSRRKYLLKGFYRELVLKDNTYTRLIEAAVDIQKYGIRSELPDRARIVQLRKSDSYVEYDWMSKLINLTFGEKNQLYEIIDSDIANFHERRFRREYIFKDDFLSKYNFALDDVTMMDSVKIYKIKFYEKNFENYSAIIYHWIYVRSDDFAIIKYVYKYKFLKNLERYKNINYENNSWMSEIVNYKKYNGKYYPYLFESMMPINAKYGDKTTGEGKQYTKSILLINDIITKNSEYEKIKLKYSDPKDIDLYNQEFEYNPEFWKNFNTMQLNPLYKQVKSDLTKKKTLEEQFIDNGK